LKPSSFFKPQFLDFANQQRLNSLFASPPLLQLSQLFLSVFFNTFSFLVLTTITLPVCMQGSQR
jgi:hypothetical protein